MYRKECYVFAKDSNVPAKAVVRNYREEDFSGLLVIQQESFPPPFPSELWWNEEQLRNHVTLFPEGALCVEIDGELVGSMTGLLVTFDPTHPEHTWAEATDNGYIRNHNPSGDTLYVVDISVRPSYRKWGLGKLLMQAMYEVVVHQGLARLLGGGRMSGYHRHAGRLTAQAYLEEVLAGELQDPVITFLLRCGRTPVQVVADYLEDEESRNYAALMEWKNPFLIEGVARKSSWGGFWSMEYHRITSIDDPLFRHMHDLMKTVFPPEEVLAFDLWKEPLEDEGIRVFVAMHDGEVVGATEYRYYADDEVAMTDFTIIGREGLGVGPFLVKKREEDLLNLVEEQGRGLKGMFAEIYNPYLVEDHSFGGIKPMDPFVRREVLSHLGYRRLDFPYVHPSWQQDGEPVSGLDLCFLSYDWDGDTLPGALIGKFLRRYYAVLPNKPQAWETMVEQLEQTESVPLRAF